MLLYSMAVWHVARMSDSQDTFRALRTSTCGLPKDWRRRPGRPRHTWLRTLNADLHLLNHGLNSARRLAQDRERWRQLVETATLQPGARSWWWWWWRYDRLPAWWCHLSARPCVCDAVHCG